jgi:hypothetical protein
LRLVTVDTRDGETIAIFLGCPLPFVLREKGVHFRLVGHAFSNGIMNGEVLTDVVRREGDIVLC